ncbi:LPXTG cell wall anchor domain-containing protein [Corynebacterium accolens]|uniref:LPXTG cell wall anchor domain-containing protein n=1 Tax=Corynebacterium accolens TaxID=38284 RepID=UPI00254D1463|nr:LPXTG cell wall anchor domain-containing protein [Corynebacterium accolens]MDK8504474.1 LPXTG cell wall anchor domain-containing protein [Corynebacterium accolens]MDK8661620.1 LPXTG cell wall anchor domain-containing protein [Corynebacterium accolens]
MDTDKTKVKPGDTVNAHVEVDGEAPYPESGPWTYGKSDVTAVIFVLQVDPKLTVPSVDNLNFKWGDGKDRKPFRTVPYPEQNAVLLEFSARDLPLGPKPSFSLDFPATVNKSVKDGEELGVTVQTEMTIRPTLDWTYGDWEMRDIGQACFRDAEGTLSFENPGHYGTWMADLWLGTDVDHFKLNGKPEFKVTGPDGKDLTNTVFPSDAYPQRTVNPIAKPTIYTGSDATDFNGYRWLSRYQWKINEENLAGDVWIPEGSTIRVKQRVESTECSFNPSEDNFGVKVESRNAPLAELDTAEAALTVDENPEAPTPSETEPKPDTEKESEPSSTSSTPSTEATTTSDSPEPSEPTEPSDPSEPSETTPNEDGETTATTTEPETEAPEPEPEEDPEPSSPSSTTSTEVTTTSETPASSTTETTKTTTPTCKPSESESPKPSDPSEPSEPSEPTPSESGKTTVPSTEPESEDPDCEPSGSPEPTPSSTTTPTLPQPLLPVPLLPLGKNKDKEPSTTPEKPKSSEPKGTEPQEPSKQQETTQPQNGSQAHAATSTTAPAPAKGDHSQRTTGLANTGASVIGLVIAGIIAIAGGLFLVRRNRNA